MHQRVMQSPKEHNILYQKQFGFQKHFSKAHAIIKVIEEIEESLDSKQSVCVVLIDLQKATDTVNHNILLNKLSHYGIRNTANNWFSSYIALLVLLFISLIQSMVFILIYKIFDSRCLKDQF